MTTAMPKNEENGDSNGSGPVGRSFTVSMAVAGSGIDNTMSLELATLVGFPPAERSVSLEGHILHSFSFTAELNVLGNRKFARKEVYWICPEGLFLSQYMLTALHSGAVKRVQLAGQIARAAAIFRIDEVRHKSCSVN